MSPRRQGKETQRLMQPNRDGGSDFWDQFVCRYRPLLRGVIGRALNRPPRDPQVLEELEQRCWVRFLVQLERGLWAEEEPLSVGGYLAAIARNETSRWLASQPDNTLRLDLTDLGSLPDRAAPGTDASLMLGEILEGLTPRLADYLRYRLGLGDTGLFDACTPAYLRKLKERLLDALQAYFRQAGPESISGPSQAIAWFKAAHGDRPMSTL